MKLVFLLISFFSISALAAGDNLYGDSAGKHYDFYAKAETGNVYGIIMNKKFDFIVRKSSQNVFGTLPCGQVDFYYRTASKNIFGNLCGEKFDLTYSTEKEVLDTARQMVLDAAASEFPLPLRKSVSSFISEKINF